MASLVLRVLDDAAVEGREVMETGVSMVGLGGDDVFCGRCGREMMHQFPIRTMKVKMLYRCAACGAVNELALDG